MHLQHLPSGKCTLTLTYLSKVRMAKINQLNDSRCWQEFEGREIAFDGESEN